MVLVFRLSLTMKWKMWDIITDIAVNNCEWSSEAEQNHKSEWKCICEFFGLISAGCMLIWRFQAAAMGIQLLHSSSLHREHSLLSHRWAAKAPVQLSPACWERNARASLRNRFSNYPFPSTSERIILRAITILLLLTYPSTQTLRSLREPGLFPVSCQESR